MERTGEAGTGTRSEASGEGWGYRGGRGEVGIGGTQTRGGERGVGRGTSQSSGERGTENDRGHQTPHARLRQEDLPGRRG